MGIFWRFLHQSQHFADIRRGKKDRKIERKIEEGTTGQKYNGLPYSIGQP